MIPRLRRNPALVGLLALLALYGAAAVRYHDRNFASARVAANLLTDNAFLGIVAVGMTFVILSGGIDLSVGAVMSLCSIVVGVLITERGWPPWTALLSAIALGAGLGTASGATIHFLRIPAFIVTLAAMFFARGLGFLIHLESIGIHHPQHARLAELAIPLWAGARLSPGSLLLLGCVAAGTYVARYTSFGRNLYALGGSEEAAHYMGLPVGRTRIGVYALSGACAGLAGVVLTLYQSSGSHFEGVGLELDAIAAVVIGGTLLTGGVGGVPGTLVGVLIIGLIRTIVDNEGGLSSGLIKVVVGGLLLAFVLIQRGLLRKA